MAAGRSLCGDADLAETYENVLAFVAALNLDALFFTSVRYTNFRRNTRCAVL